VISNSLTITPFSTAGAVHNSATGLLSASLIVRNADVDQQLRWLIPNWQQSVQPVKVSNSATTATEFFITASTIVFA